MHSLSPDVFARRRRRLIDEVGEDGAALVVGPPPRNRSNDTDYPYRPSSDVLYLTGFGEPEAVVLLIPGHDDGDFALFVPDRDPNYEQWEGRRAGPEGAKEKYGADQAYNLSELDEKLPELLAGRSTLFYSLGSDPAMDRRVIPWIRDKRHRRNQVSSIPGQVADLRDLLYPQRLVKDEEELVLIRRACEISSEAHILAMKYCRPGMYEYELQALIEYHFRRNGGCAPAYNSIVGAGDNATILHYTDNHSQIDPGDIVLIDAGCEYQYYAGDITRSFPASGSFTPAQRDLYQAVLDIQEAALAEINGNTTVEAIRDLIARRMTEALLNLGVLNGDPEELIEEKAFKKYYPHGFGHPLGVDVHDVGHLRLSEDDDLPLVAGMVLTLEPGIYIPADDESVPEEMRGVGIRIEDDLLVTPDGCENLTQSCPKSVEELEAIVGTGEASALNL